MNSLRPPVESEPRTICRLPSTNFTYGDITLQFRNDGYLNATKMCQDAGKEWKHYHELARTKAFIATLSTSVAKTTDQLIITTTTGPNELRGTYVHRHIAINLAQWISPEFAVAVSELVFRYATGQVTTEESQRVAANIAAQVQVQESTDPPAYTPSIEERQEDQRLYSMHKSDRGVYFGMIDTDKVRLGRSDAGIGDRVDIHRRDFPTFCLFFALKCNNPYALERKLLEHPMIEKVPGVVTRNGVETQEVIRLKSTFTKVDLKVLATQLLAELEAEEAAVQVASSAAIERERMHHEEFMLKLQFVEKAFTAGKETDDIERIMSLVTGHRD